MTEWLVAMSVALLLFLLVPQGRTQKLRVWLVMLAGLPVAHFFPNVWAYLVIDLVIAAIVMVPPKSTWQRVIGLCYVGMALLTTGYILRDIAGVYIFLSAANNPEMLRIANDFLGWLATATLLAWGGHGIFATLGIIGRDSRDLSPAKQGRVR